jgi:hypothetical protein
MCITHVRCHYHTRTRRWWGDAKAASQSIIIFTDFNLGAGPDGEWNVMKRWMLSRVKVWVPAVSPRESCHLLIGNLKEACMLCKRVAFLCFTAFIHSYTLYRAHGGVWCNNPIFHFLALCAFSLRLSKWTQQTSDRISIFALKTATLILACKVLYIKFNKEKNIDESYS